MRTLAIDPGTRRVGLALSDSGGTLATPHSVLTVTNLDAAADPILKLIASESVQRVIVGLPLNMDDGSLGPAARSIIAWTNGIRKKSDVPFFFVDERLSSFAAEQQLIDRKRGGEKLTRKRKKEQLDAIAAATFLQEFLDGKLRSIEVE